MSALDFVVLAAMAVTAAAFAAGLIMQAGIPAIPAIVAAAALYLAMAASYIVVARESGTSDTYRLDEVESALEVIDSDLQRIDRVEDEVSRLGPARLEELAAELDRVHARVERVSTDLEAETLSQREKISNDLGLLEGLIKQLSHELTSRGMADVDLTSLYGADTAEPRAEPAESEDAARLDEETEIAIAAITEVVEPEEDAAESEAVLIAAEIAETAEPASAPDIAAAEQDYAAAETGVTEDGISGVLRQAIEAGRVDLYLQPIVTLPERKVRYYEGLTRIRNAADEVVLPGAYLPVAEDAGMLPLIDNVLLVKSVQVLRRRASSSKVKGLFCNISSQALLDPDFFPELVEFLEENSGLSESLIFEMRQSEIMGLTRAELGALDTLGALGFHFSLDHVVDLDIDYIGLSDRYFRFIKIDAETFLHRLEERGAPLPPAEMLRYLEGFGLQLIVEKVADEASVTQLIGMGVELAQGNLFAPAKPMSPALSRELEDADAA